MITGFEPLLISILLFSLLAGVIVVVVIVVVLLSRNISFDRLDLHVFSIPENVDPDKFFEELVGMLNRLGYSGVRRDNKYVVVVDNVVKITLELVKERKPVILYYASVDAWLALLMLILLFTPLTWAVIVIGLFLYLRYDSVKRLIYTTISNLLQALTIK